MLSGLFVNAEATVRAISNQNYQGATTGGAATTGSGLVSLTAGDTVMVKSFGSGGAISVGLGTFGYTYFMGFLVSRT